MKNLYPMKLSPVAKTAIWGGNKLSTEYEAKRQKEFDRILNDALNSVTLSTVEQYGTILKSKRSDYDNY